MTILHSISIFGMVCLISLNLNAEPLQQDHNHQASHQKAHLHGYATLTLALVGSALEISLESPAANIVGFEHRATSNAQIKTAENAKSILESPSKIFSLLDGHCSLKQTNVNFSALQQQDETYEKTHSEITASYKYNCLQGKKINVIKVNLIDLFPKIETIKAMWLTENKQGAVELTPKSNLIQIR